MQKIRIIKIRTCSDCPFLEKSDEEGYNCSEGETMDILFNPFKDCVPEWCHIEEADE